MSIRCAICGSKRVIQETKNEGYDVKKGVIGSVLFGHIGALAGANGKKNTYYHCSECGERLGYSLNEVISNQIDELLSDQAKYASILREKKQKYKNIEWEDKRIDEAVATEMILEKFKIKQYISTRELAWAVDDLGAENIHDKIHNSRVWDNATNNLADNFKIIIENINGESHYRLAVNDDEAREYFLKDKLVKHNFELYESMLLEKIEYQKNYSIIEYKKILEQVFCESIDFSSPYAVEAFMFAMGRRMISYSVKDNFVVFKTEDDIEEEEEKYIEEAKKNDEYLKKCILNFLVENQDYFRSKQIRDQSKELSQPTEYLKEGVPIIKVESLLKQLINEGKVKTKIEDSATYYAIYNLDR